MTHRPANQVVIVRGARRAALYDFRSLKAARMQRIPLDIANLIETHALARTDEQRRWIAFLLSVGFLEDAIAPHWQPFHADWTHPFGARLHSITIDVRTANVERLNSWISASMLARELHLGFYLEAQPCSDIGDGIASLIAAVNAASFELFPFDSDQSVIFDRDGVVIARRNQQETRGDRVVQQLLPSLAAYQRSRRGSETIGQIHVDADLCVWPHRDEAHYLLGDLRLQSLDDILAGARYRAIRENSKDRRAVCRHCELRYACTSNYTRRADPHDIHSAPRDCTYDPLSDDQQAEQFRTSAVAETA